MNITDKMIKDAVKYVKIHSNSNSYAEDAVADALLYIAENGIEDVSFTFLCEKATNALNNYRHSWNGKMYTTANFHDHILDDSLSPADILIYKQLKDELTSKLTNRENELVEFLAHGETYKELAVRFGIAEATVRKHAENIRTKIMEMYTNADK